MAERRYTISEIDEMRNAVGQMFPLQSNPKPAEIEDRLRTHMVNGTDPAELAEASKEYLKGEFERWQETQRMCREFNLKSERTGA